MFVNVGRFQFRPMEQGAWQELLGSIEADITRNAQASQGFRSVSFSCPGETELMLVWLWESAADWQAAFPRFVPFLQEHVMPKLAQAPDRVGADVIAQVVA